MTDRFTTYDAAYLLGALSPEERRDYEAHLRECDECARAVARLAGIPGLLARARPPEPADEGPVPEGVLSGLLAEVARRRARRRRLAVVAAAAAVVAVIVAGVVLGSDRTEPDDPGVAMTAVAEGIPIEAWAVLDSEAWGTRIRLTCSYEGHGYGGSGSYRLVVVDADGNAEQVATWDVVPGRVARVTGSTSLDADEIAAVEVRTERDTPVLTLSPRPLEEP